MKANQVKCLVAMMMLAMSLGACSKVNKMTEPTATDVQAVTDTSHVQKPVATPDATYTGVDWSNNVFSEACYALNVYRTGSSTIVYKGIHLGDWDYVRSDNTALNVMTSYIGGTVNRGSIDGTYGGGHLGGYCKFFVDLVLYRSSYGIGNGWHLVLPGGGYDYSGYMTPCDITQAKTGWVIQHLSPGEHSAIVAANLGWGLDLIDSNNVDRNGTFVIARHSFAWNQLGGYTAYKPTYMKQF